MASAGREPLRRWRDRGGRILRAAWVAIVGLASACQVFAGLGDFGPADEGAGASGATGAVGALGGAGGSGGAGAVGGGTGGVGLIGPGGGGTGNVPESCFDDRQNGGETGIDCGGPCAGCPVGGGCGGPDDCATGVCDVDTCACGDSVVISEYRARGPSGGNDEFVELYNASAAPVVLDSDWTIESRPFNGTSYTVRWTGQSDTLLPYHHYLIVGTAFSGGSGDDTLDSGIGDGSIVRLLESTTLVDVLCTCLATPCAPEPSCEGEVVPDPNDNMPTPRSLERKLGGSNGSCQDTDDNAVDFHILEIADPQGVADGPIPPP